MSSTSYVGNSINHCNYHYNHILTREEAKQKMEILETTSFEYTQLQDALIRIEGIVEICLPDHSYKIDASRGQKLLGGFGSSEHVAIGEGVTLKELPNNILFYRGLTAVSYPHIVALAGDFYGIYGAAISLPGGTEIEKENRFKKAFETLFQASSEELGKIIQEIKNECFAVRNASLPHHCYSSQMMEKNSAIKKIKGDIGDLLIDNSDHFSENAREAYLIGHRLALEEARKATDLAGLSKAYAMDAFACHFLTDLFAAGHVRNQRGPLETFLINELGFPMSIAKKFAGILTGAQHEKDGNAGLNVCNDKEEFWRTYGDGCYFTPKNEENKKKAIFAIQMSADEVFDAWDKKKVEKESQISTLIPKATKLNPLPLYEVIDGKKLVLYIGNEQFIVKTKEEYIRKALLGQAMTYLPSEYVLGTIKDGLSFDTPLTQLVAPFLVPLQNLADKVVLPFLNKLCGKVWHLVGLASHCQIEQLNEKLNNKFDEMAQGIQAVYDVNLQVLEKVREIDSTLNIHILLQEVKSASEKIDNAEHDLKHSGELHGDDGLKRTGKHLWDAYIVISKVLSNSKLMEGYWAWLGKKGGMDTQEKKIETTSLFRFLINSQLKAIYLWAFIYTKRHLSEKDVVDKIQFYHQKIVDNLAAQIKVNSPYIDTDFMSKPDNIFAIKFKINRARQSMPTIKFQIDSLMKGISKAAPKILAKRIRALNVEYMKRDAKILLSEKDLVKELSVLHADKNIASLLDFAKWAALGIHRSSKRTWTRQEGDDEESLLSICIDGKKKVIDEPRTMELVEKPLHKIFMEADGLNLNQTLGLMVRKLTYFVTQEVFQNGGNLAEHEQKVFAPIAANVKEQKTRLDPIFQNVFAKTSYTQQDIIACIPQMLINYKDQPSEAGGDGLSRLTKLSETEELLSYYQYQFLPLIRAHTQFFVEQSKKKWPQDLFSEIKF